MIMALIECPECKQIVSNEAVSCPQCGYPLKKAVAEEKPKTIEKKKSFTVGYRSTPGAIVGANIVILIFGFLFIVGAIVSFVHSYMSGLIFVGIFCLAFGLFCIVLGFIYLSYFIGNNNNMDKNCIEYDAEKDKLVLCTVFGEIIEIDVEDYICLKDNFFTDNMLLFTYRTKEGLARKAKLGYCSNRDELRKNIASIRK